MHWPQGKVRGRSENPRRGEKTIPSGERQAASGDKHATRLDAPSAAHGLAARVAPLGAGSGSEVSLAALRTHSAASHDTSHLRNK